MSDWQNFFSSTGQLILAGAAGGIVRWLTLKQGWLDGLISVAVGSILAAYLGPVAVAWLKPVADFSGAGAEAAIGLGGFLVGIGGIVVSGFVIDLWHMRNKLMREQGGGQADDSQ